MKKHLIIVSLIAAALSAVLGLIIFNTDLLPTPASPELAYISLLMRIMAVIALIFFSIIISFIGYTLIFFRRRKGETGEGWPIRGNPRLELIWSLIPLAIVIGLSVYGAIVFEEIMRPGDINTDLEIKVTAFRFGWQFEYTQYEIQTFEMRLPVDRRVMLRMESRDVIHAFWVPEFGPKMDIVPGMVTEMFFTPTLEGQYTLMCAELCGYGHPFMTAPVMVTSAEEFEGWAASQPKVTPTPTPSPGPSPPVSPAPSPTTMPGPAPTGGANAVTIDLTAQNFSFNMSTITVPAGAEVTVNFENADQGVPHNFSVYTDASANTPIFMGNIITGPSTATYHFTAPAEPGTYHFQCDPHAPVMNGDFIVQ